jgi:hypothetical protein
VTGSTPSRFRVECTECEFVHVFDRSDAARADEAATDHLERTGHTLRVLPVEE